MSEFLTNGSGEYLVIPEDERESALKLSERVLRDSLDDSECWIGETGFATHIRFTCDGEVVLLASQDSNKDSSRTKYILDANTGGFMVIRDTLNRDDDQETSPNLDPAFIHETIEAMASLQQYLGDEQDWYNFMEILQDGRTATANLRAFYESAGRIATHGDNDWDISELL